MDKIMKTLKIFAGILRNIPATIIMLGFMPRNKMTKEYQFVIAAMCAMVEEG